MARLKTYKERLNTSGKQKLLKGLFERSEFLKGVVCRNHYILQLTQFSGT